MNEDRSSHAGWVCSSRKGTDLQFLWSSFANPSFCASIFGIFFAVFLMVVRMAVSKKT